MTTQQIRFDPVVTLGNVLTIITLLVGAAAFIIKTDARVTVVEQILHEHDRRIDVVERQEAARPESSPRLGLPAAR